MSDKERDGRQRYARNIVEGRIQSTSGMLRRFKDTTRPEYAKAADDEHLRNQVAIITLLGIAIEFLADLAEGDPA